VEAWQEAWRRWNITQTLGKKAGGEVEAVQSQRARRTLDLTVHKDGMMLGCSRGTSLLHVECASGVGAAGATCLKALAASKCC